MVRVRYLTFTLHTRGTYLRYFTDGKVSPAQHAVLLTLAMDWNRPGKDYG